MSGSIRVLVVAANEAAVEDVIPELATFQGLVGGYIQAISGDGWSAYINEDGKSEALPFNPVATAVAERLGWPFSPGDYLVGTVVFMGGFTDDDGDATSVAEPTITLARSLS